MYKYKGKVKADILKERDRIDPTILESHCQLKVVDVTCLDCDKKFKWYVGTQRCSSCAITHKNRLSYTPKDEYLKTPMVIINSKGLVVGEGDRPRDLYNWFRENTELKDYKTQAVISIRHSLNRNKLEGILGVKFICYWIMYKENYTFDTAVKLINRRHKNLGQPHTYKFYTEQQKELILNVFNETGMHKDIAVKYGLSRCNVAHIKTGRSHSLVTGKQFTPTYKKKTI